MAKTGSLPARTAAADRLVRRSTTVHKVQELWPLPNQDLDVASRLAQDERPKPQGRPWVVLVMITTIDGAIAVDGVSGGLGSPDDQQRFVAARRSVDGIIVGARTAVVEDYRPSTSPIAVVTASMSLDPTARLFSDPERRPLLFTTDQAAGTKGPDFDGIAEVIALGDSVDPAQVLADLDNRGMASVMLEGGPTLNSHFLRADLVDELLISYSPLVAGGDAVGLARGEAMPTERRFSVDRIVLGGDLIFVRYLRDR